MMDLELRLSLRGAGGTLEATSPLKLACAPTSHLGSSHSPAGSLPLHRSEAHGSISSFQATNYNPKSRKWPKVEAPTLSGADVAADGAVTQEQVHAVGEPRQSLPLPAPLPHSSPLPPPAVLSHSLPQPEPPYSAYAHPSHPWTLTTPQAALDVYSAQQAALAAHKSPLDPQLQAASLAVLGRLPVGGWREGAKVPGALPVASFARAEGIEARAGGASVPIEGTVGLLSGLEGVVGGARGTGSLSLLGPREGEGSAVQAQDASLEANLRQKVAPGCAPGGGRDREESGGLGQKPLPPKKRDWVLMDALQGCFNMQVPAAHQQAHQQSQQQAQQPGHQHRGCSPGPEGHLQGKDGSSPDDAAPTLSPLRSCSANGTSSGDDCSEEQPLATHASGSAHTREGGGGGRGRRRKQGSRAEGGALLASGGGGKGSRSRAGVGQDAAEGGSGLAGAKGNRKGSYHRFGTDGFMWSKYSHKRLRNTKTERSYYACVEKDRLACPARKLVDRPQKMFALGDYSCDIVTLEGTHNHPPVGAPEDPNNRLSPNPGGT